jgi:hypothetical protein
LTKFGGKSRFGKGSLHPREMGIKGKEQRNKPREGRREGEKQRQRKN